MDLIELQLALGRAPRLNASRLVALFEAVGGEPAQTRSLTRLFDLSSAARKLLTCIDAGRLRADRDWVESSGVRLVDLWSPDYPPQLARVPNRPMLLYIQGDVSTLSSAQLAMAGSRRPSIGGRRTAHRFAAQLAAAGLTITSGLAEGIDAASHEGALSANGRSIAVLGTGLDQIYPPLHRPLVQRLLQRGALVSELPPRSPPLRRHFPMRNRIISGLSLGVLVVEAARSSGSLITADLARRQDRKRFAVPGSIYNPMARGCHALIRQGAQLVEEPAEVLRQLEFGVLKQMLIDSRSPAVEGGAGAGALDKNYKILLDAVGFEPASVDELVARTGLPSQSVASTLLTLELEGAIGSLADGQYLRLSSDDHAT